MARGIAESQEQIAGQNTDHPELERLLELSFNKVASQPASAAGKAAALAASSSEEDLLREAILALRAMRYGSVVLVVHEGHLVEISKTVRIRRSPGAQPGREKEK